MRSISLHLLSLGTSMFPLDQLGSKRIAFRKTARVRGQCSLHLLSPAADFTLHYEKPEAMWWQHRKQLFVDLTPVSLVKGVKRPKKYFVCNLSWALMLNLKKVNCKKLSQIYY